MKDFEIWVFTWMLKKLYQKITSYFVGDHILIKLNINMIISKYFPCMMNYFPDPHTPHYSDKCRWFRSSKNKSWTGRTEWPSVQWYQSRRACSPFICKSTKWTKFAAHFSVCILVFFCKFLLEQICCVQILHE